jgi:hypothetical protein
VVVRVDLQQAQVVVRLMVVLGLVVAVALGGVDPFGAAALVTALRPLVSGR